MEAGQGIHSNVYVLPGVCRDSKHSISERRRQLMYVFVLAKDGSRLMPTNIRKARRAAMQRFHTFMNDSSKNADERRVMNTRPCSALHGARF
jgi:hypothetical protein